VHHAWSRVPKRDYSYGEGMEGVEDMEDMEDMEGMEGVIRRSTM